MSVTPGVEWRRRAMSASTFTPGSWPPSPGFAPCATLISISTQLFRYSAVTPKRPDATCFMALDALSPFSRSLKRAGSSPPSPESDLAPMRFIAMDSVSCASGLSAPSEMPGETSRFRMLVIDSTCSGLDGVGGRLETQKVAQVHRAHLGDKRRCISSSSHRSPCCRRAAWRG